MEKIERGYATIYIDREGETLVDDRLGIWTEQMINDYYSIPGSLQWNYYLIIPTDVLPKAKWAFENPDAPTEEELKKLKKRITNDDTYGRKYVLLPGNVDLFIHNFFPPFVPEQREEFGKVVLLKGKSRKDVKMKLRELGKLEPYKHYLPIDSFHRNFSSLKSLYELDYLRKQLLRNPEMKILFYTHISNEHSWAKHKFNFLLPEIIKTLE
jgi:hypothetical protein